MERETGTRTRDCPAWKMGGSVSAGVLMKGFWRVRGGRPFAALGFDARSAARVNIVPIWKGVDSTSIALLKIQATVGSKLVWIYNSVVISSMQVSKWGISLAVRPPAVVAEALDLKEGDEIEISIAGKRDFKVARDRSKERALEQLRQMKWSFPPDFIFNREEINER